MATKDTAPIATVAPVLPPVPGGGSWRPNAAGDGWVDNLAAEAETAPATDSKTISQE